VRVLITNAEPSSLMLLRLLDQAGLLVSSELPAEGGGLDGARGRCRRHRPDHLSGGIAHRAAVLLNSLGWLSTAGHTGVVP
jgi:hypothetical protein